MSKKIAIIKDGYSDFLVLKSFITSIFNLEQNIEITDACFIDLTGLQIGEAIGKYIDKANREKEIGLKGKFATDLKNTIITILFTAIKNKNLTNKDIIILNGDTEHQLMNNEKFFDEWVRRLYSIINYSIEEFYNRMLSQGYSYANLPIIIPLILFPSIEILVAPCYLSDNDKLNIRELRAKPDLKFKIWNTENIPYAIDSGEINRVLDLCFNNLDKNSLNSVYKEIPEVRNLIHILTYPNEYKQHNIC